MAGSDPTETELACYVCRRELHSVDIDRHVAHRLICQECESVIREADQRGDLGGREDYEWLLLRWEEFLACRRFEAARGELWLRRQLASLRRWGAARPGGP